LTELPTILCGSKLHRKPNIESKTKRDEKGKKSKKGKKAE